MTNEELILKIRSGDNVDDNKRELYLKNEKLILKIANHFSGTVDIEDLKQEGYFGLMTALDLWNEDGGATFSSYATYWIRQVMRRYIDNCGDLVRLPTHRRDRIYQYKKAVEEFNQEFMRSPSSRELAIYLNISQKEIDSIRKDAQYLNVKSMSEPIGDDEDLTLEDTIEDTRDGIEEIIDKVQREELSSLLWSLVDTLEETESQILIGRYRDGKTISSCGEDLGLTPDKAKTIEQKAIRNLRKPTIKKKLEPFFEERISAMIFNTGLESFQRTWISAPERVVLYIEEKTERSKNAQED